MKVEQIRPRANERYPWNYRIGFSDTKLGILWGEIQPWTNQTEIPGVWVGQAFYTNEQGATMFALKWS